MGGRPSESTLRPRYSFHKWAAAHSPQQSRVLGREVGSVAPRHAVSPAQTVLPATASCSARPCYSESRGLRRKGRQIGPTAAATAWTRLKAVAGRHAHHLALHLGKRDQISPAAPSVATSGRSTATRRVTWDDGIA